VGASYTSDAATQDENHRLLDGYRQIDEARSKKLWRVVLRVDKVVLTVSRDIADILIPENRGTNMSFVPVSRDKTAGRLRPPRIVRVIHEQRYDQKSRNRGRQTVLLRVFAATVRRITFVVRRGG
jgi:hypothetical protein